MCVCVCVNRMLVTKLLVTQGLGLTSGDRTNITRLTFIWDLHRTFAVPPFRAGLAHAQNSLE